MVTSLVVLHLHFSLITLLSYQTACVRYLLLTVSSFKSLSVHNPSYLSPAVLEHTLAVETYKVWLWTALNWCQQT